MVLMRPPPSICVERLLLIQSFQPSRRSLPVLTCICIPRKPCRQPFSRDWQAIDVFPCTTQSLFREIGIEEGANFNIIGRESSLRISEELLFLMKALISLWTISEILIKITQEVVSKMYIHRSSYLYLCSQSSRIEGPNRRNIRGTRDEIIVVIRPMKKIRRLDHIIITAQLISKDETYPYIS